MKVMGVNELRESFLAFFESKGHLREKSAPLVPQDDNSVLLINAGMTPLKKYFQGAVTPPRKRMATCQKCIRTPDIENVGKTARHGTYFEMLGNFSFGDYFKKDAIRWAWEYFTEVLGLPKDKLYASIYLEDDEAAELWASETDILTYEQPGYPRITRLGKADNFWEHGSGPCGPCSEIYFDRGEQYGCGSSDCKVGCECDRFVELWNLVFTQFDSDGKNNYTPLENKNIDTGMGIERLACVIQGVPNMFEIDTVRKILDKACELTGKKYGADTKTDVSIRIITDHCRSGTFMVGDGVLPSNEGRGYVLRRLLRRAARHGRMLGVTCAFMCEICKVVISENAAAYPELVEKREYILKVISEEERSFGETVEKGLSKLREYISALVKNADKTGAKLLSGDKIFKLHDTYGFPFDLTKEILGEQGIEVDVAGFDKLMREQRESARKNRAFKGGWDESSLAELADVHTEFIGYNKLNADTKILAVIENGKSVHESSCNEQLSVVIEKTPFYAESGGQVGDTGEIASDDFVFDVTDTTKTSNGQFVCSGFLKSGTIRVGSPVTANVNKPVRTATKRNHTAAHLLQAALRQVLGDHVHQAGSYVDAHKCRFDFSHFSALSADERSRVECIVNKNILAGYDVDVREMPIDDARKLGATALFGEKYGDTVRVVTVGSGAENPVSVEFCGGTHIENTARIGLFRIVSESAAAAGVRRIEAVTGEGVIEHIRSLEENLMNTARLLKISDINGVTAKVAAVLSDVSEKARETAKLKSEIAKSKANNVHAKIIKGTTVLTAETDEDANGIREIADRIAQSQRADSEDFIILVAGAANFFCVCSKKAIEKGANAGQIVKNAAEITNGKGGGKPDSAMAGIGDKSKKSAAIEKIDEIVEKFIK
ncbi:alanine--tRNA ligase [Clostridia bacterium]|nr:alanine--tRNA ligase [Clostridia bacterium]